ncbi:transmembrane protein 235 [Anopheles ziemanni]|uniref:transmembrane protein 235 n=1 Tax=Anopheles coustani TaxID=139045 RepID=UPI00265A2C65|nr:transmembrane protein 235 [Anopheles coustani]XP_058173442.1 transmembrane protein 235 [Anopheles ziemanni]
MPCSAVTLSLATISAIIAVALLAIAFSTDNWQSYEVKRTNIQPFIAKHPELTDSFNNRLIYYTRTRGLFRYCYPKERPPASSVQIYLSPVETHCSNIDYFPAAEEQKESDSFTDDIMTRLHLARSVIAAFILSFVVIFCAFWTGLSGCWKRSAGAITATAILMLTACLLAAGAMGLWHTVEFFEKEKVVGEDYYQQWNNALRDNTRLSYDWSYIVAWAGVACSLLASILLSGAAVCLRGEREREEQLNLQYLMPVYPQKQPPYPYGGFPQPQLYPQPYYHGSQYGPYNY